MQCIPDKKATVTGAAHITSGQLISSLNSAGT